MYMFCLPNLRKYNSPGMFIYIYTIESTNGLNHS